MRLIKDLFLSRIFFICIGITVSIFIGSYFFPGMMLFAKLIFFSLFLFMIFDYLILFITPGITAERKSAKKLSNGDDNIVEIHIENQNIFTLKVEVIDEIPFQFQKRDFLLKVKILSKEKKVLLYALRPVERGEYNFGDLNIYISSYIGLIMRRFKFSQGETVPVYPSIIQMQKYDFFAISNRLSEIGIKKIRRIGTSMEFDQVHRYVVGDDYRKINWKATARKSDLMVNQYRDERSQHIYSFIDMGRTMKMPFEGMTLLDYAINASLVISNIAIRKEDRAGIITFSHKIESILPADRRYSQIFKILELLYNCTTNFLESDYELLYTTIARKIKQRSLILLFTNFETLSSLKRNMNYLSMIARKHFLVIIFFENTEIKEILDKKADSIEKVYIKTIAEKFAYEKKQITKELDSHGIQSILTSPENLTVNTINKYLEIKARGLI